MEPYDSDLRIIASRDSYDLSVVYLHNQPLKPIYHKEQYSDEGTHPKVTLDVHTLLHILNFWHGHLASVINSVYSDAIPTYGEMALSLLKRGFAPRQWDRPLQEALNLEPRWFGHYSCTHPIPRKLCDIEEHQTCAEDWVNQFGRDGVHPLSLDIVSTSVAGRGWWPPIFATIPIIEATCPVNNVEGGTLFVRGIAPFLAPPQDPALYPNFTALRIRGMVHPVPDQEEIPGWMRIVMILYKPTHRYLLAVLDENTYDGEQEEGAFNQMSLSSAPLTIDITEQSGLATTASIPEDLAVASGSNPPPPATSAEAVENSLKEELEERKEMRGPLGPNYFTRDFIATMEDKLHPPHELAWEDISYAYVYEGAIIPGGKIMMGRHWRIGPPWNNDAFEVGDGADRGPWVFWC